MTAAQDEMESETAPESATAVDVDVDDNRLTTNLRRRLERAERMLAKSEKYNEELRKQVETLSEELHQLKSHRINPSQATQTSVLDYNANDEREYPIIENNWLADKDENMSIAECVKAVAEEALQQTGFVYDETSGLYFDNSSGYYYDPENALYYDSATGTYYTYDQATREYLFHSQVDLSQFNANSSEETHSSVKSGKKRKMKSCKDEKSQPTTKQKRNRSSSYCNEDSCSNDEFYDETLSVEEGECSDSSSDSNSAGSWTQKKKKHAKSKYPPCIRCMVEESNVDSLPAGSLFIITCSGATIGREKYNDIRICDLQISKMHAHITYYAQQRYYTITDLGSQNGTSVNGTRIAQPKQTSEPFPLKHEDVLQLGDVRFLLHIHPGLETCDQCEPGQVQAALSAAIVAKPTVDIVSKAEKELQRRRELKQIRKKFGLEGSAFEEVSLGPKADGNYTDRAQQRRRTKGVDNPYGKTETASVDIAIRQDNKGRKLLEKMGWSEGTGLGKSQIGIVEPISIDLRAAKSGLGCQQMPGSTSMICAVKQDTWQKTRQRYADIDSLE